MRWCPPRSAHRHTRPLSPENVGQDAVFKAITMLNVSSTLALTITASDVHGDQSGVNVAIMGEAALQIIPKSVVEVNLKWLP